MQPWITIDTASVPGGREPLRLMQRGSDFYINLGPELLMGSRMRGSEEALARLGCAPLAERAGSRILIGGLGMGFTLRAALDALPETAAVEVAEIVPAVVDWNRGPLAHLSGEAVSDPRVTIHLADVARVIGTARNRYDAILLDVDNGPAGLTRDGNDGLYGVAGLRAAWGALASGGRLAVWSAFPDSEFGGSLKRIGFTVEEHKVRAQGRKGTSHVIWVAERSRRG